MQLKHKPKKKNKECINSNRGVKLVKETHANSMSFVLLLESALSPPNS